MCTKCKVRKAPYIIVADEDKKLISWRKNDNVIKKRVNKRTDEASQIAPLGYYLELNC